MVSSQPNTFLPLVIADPYPMYARLREHDPVHWSEVMDSWVVTRYRDVTAILTDSRFSANRRNAQNRFADEIARREEEFGPFGRTQTMLTSDPPEHTRLRRLVSKAFTPRMVESLRPRIQDIVDELLDPAEKAGEMDLIRDLAYPLPVIVIAEMLGVPPEDRDRFKHWSDEIVATLGGPMVPEEVLRQAQTSIHALAEYIRGVIAERRAEPRDDLISRLIAAEEEGQILSEDEMLAMVMLLLVAGNETTTNLIGNGTLALLRHPDALDQLRSQPDLIQTAIEELLRYDSPVQATGRVAMEDLDLDGHTVKAGQVVLTVLGAANRDPDQFDGPDGLTLDRKPNEHMSFGDGIHFCLGAPLARAEGQIAISALLRRFPGLRLATEEPQWGGSFILRGVKSLPVAL